jgi:signal recognition particle subunit SRP68
VLHDAGRLGAESLLEMTAYTLVLNGRFLRYRDELEDALVQLSVARGILDELAESVETTRDQALATYFADEIGPEIRYCAHELGRAKAYDVDGIVREQSAQHRAQIVDGYEALVQKLKNEVGAEVKGNERKLRPLLWEGEPVPVRNPELVDVLVKVQEGEVKLREESIEVSRPTRTRTDQEKKKRRPAVGGKSKRGVAAYDNVLLALSDAEDVARKLAEAQKNVSSVLFSSTDLSLTHSDLRQAVQLLRLESETFTSSTFSSSITFLHAASSGICSSFLLSWHRTLRRLGSFPEARPRPLNPRKGRLSTPVFIPLLSSCLTRYFKA